MSGPNRTAAGGQIDRGRRLRFTFDGRRFEGCVGDTLASALLAHDVHLVARSFKYHRPRGILCLGAEEPNALVQLGTDAYTEPNARATTIELFDGLRAQSQNRWPALHFDLGRTADYCAPLLSAGFYYKTFIGRGGAWLRYEKAIRRMAGLGRAPAAPDPDRYEHMHAHCDVLVVGAGPAGLAAALAAGRAGAHVLLADMQPEPGGRLLGERRDIGERPALAWVAGVLDELRALPDVRILTRTVVAGYYDHDFWVGCQRFAPNAAPALPRERLWKIRARETVLATGAVERPLVFPDNDRPAIMLAGAVRGYLHRYGVRAGRRVAIVTAHDDAYRSALDLAAAGVQVAALVDLRASAEGFLAQQARARGLEVLVERRILGTAGDLRVQALRVQHAAGGPSREIGCDLVAMSGGWIPAVQLYAQARGRLRYDPQIGAAVPGEAAGPLRCAGSVCGTHSLRATLAQGLEAGARAASRCGFGDGAAPEPPRVHEPEESRAEPAAAYRIVPSRRKQFVDFQTDVTVADVALAVREGYGAPEHLKRYTTAGMGADQGKSAHANVLGVLSGFSAQPLEALAPTTMRPPYQPVGFGAIAGTARAALYDPVRRTSLHAWHAGHGALFEDVGAWKRARAYPQAGEDSAAAVRRECVAARRAVALFDASTLGKIDVQGPDAAELLERLYCNRVRSLVSGRCRYGVMLQQDGMVFDDGVIARLGPDHFVVTTTTGGAARVADWIEDWLQTEWQELRAYATPVTEHYAQIAVSGARSAEVLAPLCSVKLETMPYMAVREGVVAGIPSRIFRVSFSGALGFELAVPADRAYELWSTLMGAGERFGIAPCGTDAMHVLRAEMGYIVVGQETDGSVSPIDLGLERMVTHDKFFVGKRSLARSDLVRADRRQLVGVLTEPPQEVLPEGAQLVAEPRTLREPVVAPVPMLGHITSSYFSPTCGRSIALALVEAGIARIGKTFYVPLADRCARVTLTAPRFVDASGVPLHG